MKKFVIAGVALVLVTAIAVGAASQFTLSALPEPGRTETFLATKAKHYLSAEAAEMAFRQHPPTGRRP